MKSLSTVAGFLWFAAVSAAFGASPVPSPSAASEAARIFEIQRQPAAETPLDRLVLARLRQEGVPASGSCSDPAFVRRVFLDTIGTLPTAAEAEAFLADSSPGKRQALVDRLLERPEFATYWAMKWADLLRVKSEFPINLWPNAVQAYHRWIETAVRENMPYDRFARELLTASGSNFRVPAANFFRAVQGRKPRALAQAAALTFLGTRAENWPAERLDGFAVFFSRIGYKSTSEWKEEIVYFDLAKSLAEPPLQAVFPDGRAVAIPPGRDPREVFADWLVDPKNPWFTRAIANRAWSWFLGRGIVHEPDDLRPDNPPSNPELLALLERELVGARYDLKHLFRLILVSQTYQRSSIPASASPRAEALFAHYPVRRLEAEVLADALCQISGTTEKYSSLIPEPFTFLPEEQRSIALADGSITSSFLEMFGRPARDTGLESERNNRPSADQALHLVNSSHVQRKINQGAKLLAPGRGARNPGEVVERLYLTILSRYPTAEELRGMNGYAQSSQVTRRDLLLDAAWALVNSDEFLYRH